MPNRDQYSISYQCHQKSICTKNLLCLDRGIIVYKIFFRVFHNSILRILPKADATQQSKTVSIALALSQSMQNPITLYKIERVIRVYLLLVMNIIRGKHANPLITLTQFIHPSCPSRCDQSLIHLPKLLDMVDRIVMKHSECL